MIVGIYVFFTIVVSSQKKVFVAMVAKFADKGLPFSQATCT
jgi:hypothetical protein